MHLVEYIWIDGAGALRSKTRVLSDLENIPNWNYDGSSTGQANSNNSEIILKPCAVFKNTIHPDEITLVLCETYENDELPTQSNHRNNACKLFNKNKESEPWFGLEQEYFLIDLNTNLPLGFTEANKQGQYYCSVGVDNAFGRGLVERHAKLCLEYGIKLSGVNAEVAPGQWEFQIGPCVGIEAGDHLWVARYLLYYLSEKFRVRINIEPKPIKGDWNGSGCHTNYSTKNMREGSGDKNGLHYINDAIEKLSKKHSSHMAVYGLHNETRMTGEHETADYNVFTNGVANRGASVRIGNDTLKNKQGYFEDRRPGSNCDPYLVISKIFETTVLS